MHLPDNLICFKNLFTQRFKTVLVILTFVLLHYKCYPAAENDIVSAYVNCKPTYHSEKNILNDTLVPKVAFSKEQALALARERGYFNGDAFNTITLDSMESKWIVQSEKHTHSKKRRVKANDGSCVNCRKTNGCTRVITRTLIIDAANGKVLAEKKRKIYFPNYE